MRKIVYKIFSIFIFIIIAYPVNASKNDVLKIGNKDAVITVKVFSSLTCPHCANFHEKIFNNLKEEYIDTNKVKFEHHSFPLDLAALNAEKILRCSSSVEKSFQLLNEIYKKQNKWAVGSDINKINDLIINIGLDLNLEKSKMKNCLDDDKIQEKILNERIAAQKKYKIESTPSIFINEKLYKGNHEFKAFKKYIDKLL
mgnify:FL=1